MTVEEPELIMCACCGTTTQATKLVGIATAARPPISVSWDFVPDIGLCCGTCVHEHSTKYVMPGQSPMHRRYRGPRPAGPRR